MKKFLNWYNSPMDSTDFYTLGLLVFACGFVSVFEIFVK